MKVLVISHNPMTTYQNMGKTLLSLFDSFRPEELCQLYIHISIPDTDKCHSYYRISDKDVLASYCKFKVQGREIDPELSNHQMFGSKQDEKLYTNPKNKAPFRLLGRDIMWKFSNWYNADLKKWLEREKSDRILVAPGTSKLIYEIAMKLSHRLNIPIVTYICDDYYFVKPSRSPMGRIQQKLLFRSTDQLMSRTAHLVVICDELRDKYAEKFGVPTTTIMTGTNYPIQTDVTVCERPTTITYMGNIRWNRSHSLADIGRALDEINAERGTNYELKVYTGDKTPSLLAHMASCQSIRLCGQVTGEAFEKVFRSSEILLHVEGFDEASIDRVKHSVSTKIADCMGSGIPVFAYGPCQVASMQHLIRHKCAIVATDPAVLKERLLDLFTDTRLRRSVAEQGIAVAKAFHNASVTGKKLYTIFENL